MMLAASSASGSWQYLLASTRQASASCTWIFSNRRIGKIEIESNRLALDCSDQPVVMVRLCLWAFDVCLM